jgi:hypothetical protein
MAAQAAIHASLCRFYIGVSWMPASAGMTFVGLYLSDTGHCWLGPGKSLSSPYTMHSG